MRRLPSWLIVGAVGALVALAAADALRPTGESARKTATEAGAPDLHGVLVVAGPDCSVAALRLPGLTEQQPPRQPDCGGVVWSRDNTLAARCTKTNGTEVLTANLEFTARVQGCAPAWRPDGALGVIRAGDLLVWRRRGRTQLFISKQQLAEWLNGRLASGEGWEFAEVAWIERTTVAAILQGPRSAEQALAIMSPGGLELFVPTFGQQIEDLRVSPRGDMAFARTRLEPTYSMLRRNGNEVALPRIANARSLAWSPGERWVALATRTTTFIARTGTRKVLMRIPVGGDSVAWLP
jgi:hypothetical protein